MMLPKLTVFAKFFIVLSCNVVFGSEISSLLESPEVENKLQEEFKFAKENQDYSKVCNILFPYVEMGDAVAELGLWFVSRGEKCYPDNPELKEREKRGLKYLLRSATKGNPDAIRRLSISFLHGFDGLQKNEYASKCWKDALRDKEKIKECIKFNP